MNTRSHVVRADGKRVQPFVKSLPTTSATKTQRLRAARMAFLLGVAVCTQDDSLTGARDPEPGSI